MVIYTSCGLYIASHTELIDKINAIDAVRASLLTQMLTIATTDSPVQEYMLNDGQTIIKAMYRSELSIMKTREMLLKEKNELVNQLNGRVTRNVDSKNLTGWNNGYQ